MVLHRIPDDSADLVHAAVVKGMERMQNAALDGLETVVHVGNRAFLHDIGRVDHEVVLHELPERIRIRGLLWRHNIDPVLRIGDGLHEVIGLGGEFLLLVAVNNPVFSVV